MRILVAISVLLAAAPLYAQEAEKAGPLPGDRFLLESGWILEPAGRQTPLDTFPMASALSPDGRWLLALNAGLNPPSISVLEAATGKQVGRTPVPDGWLGLVFSPKGDRVYVGGGAQAAVFEFTFSNGALRPSRTFAVVPPEKRTPRDFIGDVAFSPDGRLLYAADLYRDSVVVINPQSGVVIERFRTGRRPYRILFHPDGRSLFVTSWADGSVGHYEAANGNQLANVRLGPHPTDMVWREGKNDPQDGEAAWVARLFVAAANTNSVYTVGVTETKRMEVAEVLRVGLSPAQPLGMTPSALALDAKGNRLYVACSDANAVAVVDVSLDRAAVMGFVPTGHYPTAAESLANGGLAVLNGKSGTASFVPPFDDAELDGYTKTVYANSYYRDEKLSARHATPPVAHVIYIVTGPLEGGEKAAPNVHKLAREFVRLENFYASGDAGPDGYAWSVAAIAPSYVQKMWPATLAGRRKFSDFEGQEPASLPPAGYIWTNAHSAGLTVRNYGHFVANRPGAGLKGVQVEEVRDPVLARLTNRSFRGPDPNYPDVERAQVFVEELAEYEKTGEMPRLALMRLGGSGDTDAAIGKIVEAVSKSRFWPQTAIFIAPTHAGGGADSHLAPALAISPWVKRGSVDGNMYNTASVLRTIGLLLGLRPTTHFDAAARPMTAFFGSPPDARPYEAASAP